MTVGPDRVRLAWPFLEDGHRALARELDAWLAGIDFAEGDDLDASCRAIATALAEGGWLAHAVAEDGRLDVRALCLLREALAFRSGLADFVFAMQGLGSGPIGLFGGAEQKARWLSGVRDASKIAAFALSEPDAGSDVAAIATSARRDGDAWVLDGTKTWVSNGGLADFYVVFARSGEAPGAKGLSAFVVDAKTPGLDVEERIEVCAPHPLARVELSGCRVRAESLLGAPGQGFWIAMATLDVFRATVGAAALGFAGRALAEARARAKERRIRGKPLADHQLTRAKLADMAVDVDAAALLVYRAAWEKDRGGDTVTKTSAMAKLFATEAAQRVVDEAVQVFGGLGVVSGMPVERLYREVRALRIYEGTSEIQRLVIAREELREA